MPGHKNRWPKDLIESLANQASASEAAHYPLLYGLPVFPAVCSAVRFDFPS
jgi:hypothetical protein